MAKAKSKKSPEDFDRVGDSFSVKDFSRSTLRSPFEKQVLYNFGALENLLDFSFESLGMTGLDSIAHPVLFTECLCNPNYSRAGTLSCIYFS